MFTRLYQGEKSPVQVSINGQPVTALEGDTVAALLLTTNHRHTRTTAISGAPRAPMCLMGVCFECLVEIDGIPNQRACMTSVCDGMKITIQQGSGLQL